MLYSFVLFVSSFGFNCPEKWSIKMFIYVFIYLFILVFNTKIYDEVTVRLLQPRPPDKISSNFKIKIVEVRNSFSANYS